MTVQSTSPLISYSGNWIFEIFKNLDKKTLQKICLVCKHFLCQVALFQKYKSILILRRAVQLAYSFEKTDSRNTILLEIIKEGVICYPIIAKRTAEQLEDSEYRNQAYVDIARAEAQSNVAEATSTMDKVDICDYQIQGYSALIHACTDLDEVKDLVNGIKNRQLKDTFLIEIIKKEVKIDVGQAKQTLNEIQGAWEKIQAQAEIALMDESSLDEFRQTVLAIQDLDLRDKALSALITVEVKYSVTQAKQTVLLIKTPTVKDRALKKIVIEEVKTDPDSALATAQTITIVPLRNGAFIEIVIAKASVNVESARTTASTFQEVQIKSNLLSQIVKIAAKTKLNLAKEIADAIPIQIYKDSALLAILKVEVQKKSPQAIETFAKIKEPIFRNQASLALIALEIEDDSFADVEKAILQKADIAVEGLIELSRQVRQLVKIPLGLQKK